MAMRRFGIVVFILVAAQVAAAEPRLRDGTLDWPDDPTFVPTGTVELAATNKLYLNRCANGCVINVGQSNSINNSWPIGAQRTLTKFPFTDANWNAVVACVKDVFEPYNVVITETDPGTAGHFEIMIGGLPTDLGFDPMIGGVAPPGCNNGYLNTALVFDFAKAWSYGATNCDTACIENICTTAAQEIGHTWANMDHVIDKKDPMTYFNYNRRKYFQDANQQCGSDCDAATGRGPGGVQCTGTDTQSHTCRCTGGQAQSQNSFAIIKNLFGTNAGTPPMVSISSPKAGATVDKGFAIKVEAMDNSNLIAKLELKVDGTAIDTSMIDTLSMPSPWVFYAPDSLANGPHHIEAMAMDPQQTRATASTDVVQNPPCNASTTCPNATDACVGDRCVPGPDEPGGLGATCMFTTDCQSGQCANDGEHLYCVENCSPGDCPSGFGCLDDGQGNGFCWPGYDESGGCGCQSNRPGGPLTLGLLFAVGLYTCRRRRR
ncbi:MAG TPA: Ig-like domain-containing protein [Kofleriaceae bacterium]|nr:Ig-like domain-containing protein [Kofleriaceae bacterium]